MSTQRERRLCLGFYIALKQGFTSEKERQIRHAYGILMSFRKLVLILIYGCCNVGEQSFYILQNLQKLAIFSGIHN